MADGVGMLSNNERYDNALGVVGIVGGAATVAGSGVTIGAALGLITAPFLLGAAPVLLGIGAIAAAGAFAYDLAREADLVACANQGLEEFLSRPGGVVDTAISAGRAVVSGVQAVRGFLSGLFGGG
ncbi:MAG: hypothetical protein AB1449_14715 [Chloroflexota bacterium]